MLYIPSHAIIQYLHANDAVCSANDLQVFEVLRRRHKHLAELHKLQHPGLAGGWIMPQRHGKPAMSRDVHLERSTTTTVTLSEEP